MPCPFWQPWQHRHGWLVQLLPLYLSHKKLFLSRMLFLWEVQRELSVTFTRWSRISHSATSSHSGHPFLSLTPTGNQILSYHNITAQTQKLSNDVINGSRYLDFKNPQGFRVLSPSLMFLNFILPGQEHVLQISFRRLTWIYFVPRNVQKKS